MFGESNHLFDLSDNPAGEDIARASGQYIMRQELWEADVKPDKAAQWGFGQPEGILWFEYKSGKKREFQAQIFGSYHMTECTWEWAWHNPNAQENMTELANGLKAYGEENKIGFLTEGKFELSHDEGEEAVVFITSVCVGLSQCGATYPADAGDVVVFLAVEKEL